MLKTLLVAAALVATNFVIVGSASAGPCQHDWQRAKDGSRCGDRSSDSRPGGS